VNTTEIAQALARGAAAKYKSSGVMGKACENMDIAKEIIYILTERKGEYFRMTDIYDLLHARREHWHVMAQKITAILNILVAAGVIKKVTYSHVSLPLPDGNTYLLEINPVSLFYI